MLPKSPKNYMTLLVIIRASGMAVGLCIWFWGKDKQPRYKLLLAEFMNMLVDPG